MAAVIERGEGTFRERVIAEHLATFAREIDREAGLHLDADVVGDELVAEGLVCAVVRLELPGALRLAVGIAQHDANAIAGAIADAEQTRARILGGRELAASGHRQIEPPAIAVPRNA